jgi:hypothetical protein
MKTASSTLPSTSSPCAYLSLLRGRASDDFEIAIQLLIADMPAVFAFFPFAAGGEVLDELVAKQLDFVGWMALYPSTHTLVDENSVIHPTQHL